MPTNTSAAEALRYEYAASLVLKLLLNIKSNITASNINRVSLIHLVCKYRIFVTPLRVPVPLGNSAVVVAGLDSDDVQDTSISVMLTISPAARLCVAVVTTAYPVELL